MMGVSFACKYLSHSASLVMPNSDPRDRIFHPHTQPWKTLIPQGINKSANFRFMQRLFVIFGFRRDCPWSPASCRDYRPRKMSSCSDCPCDSASCRDSQQHHTDSHWRMDGWMACDLTSYFNSISVISERCLDYNERLFAMELRLRLRRFHLVWGSNSVR